MFMYNNIPYLCEPEDIINKVKEDCLSRNIDILRDIKPTTNAIMFTCPFHKHGQENKPSCGLITRQKSKDSLKVGMVHCFQCSYLATLEEFISNCLGIYDGGIYGAKWLSSNFLQIAIGNRPQIDLSKSLSRADSSKLNNKIEYISEEELDSYRYIHPYMYKRRMTDKTIEIFDIGYDPSFNLNPNNPNSIPFECITFPVRDENGNCLFVARRAINSKVFHYPDSAIKPVYGLYELKHYAPPDVNELYICESMINCITVWGYGKYAVALNGTGSSNQLKELSKLRYRKIILALDPDDAGIKGCHKIFKALGNSKIVTRLIIPFGKDVNDLSYDEFINLKQIFMNDKVNL